MGEKEDATTIICGGDTAGFAENLTTEHDSLKYSLLSTGGGAALEFLLGKKLPGLEAIEN
jgi:phosphoglycerate kinase